MEQSLFAPLREEGLTTLEIRHDWRSGRVALRGAREWPDDTAWARYGKDFGYLDLLVDEPVHLGHRETLALLERHGAGDHLARVIGRIREGRHEGMLLFLNRARDIRFAYHMHSSRLGIRNGRHAIRAGGIRRHEPEEDEFGVLVDGLNLSRAMSYKNAAAHMPFGGSKITVQCSPVDLDDGEAVGFLAYCLDRTRSVTGPDMGFSPGLADAMKEGGYSWNITGGFHNRIGPTGGPTAYGVFLAMKEAAAFRWGSPSLAGRTVVVQGLGAVGRPLVEEHLVKEGATVLVADVDPRPVEELCAAHPDRVRPIPLDEVLSAEADVLAPCAVGGILDEDTIPRLRCGIIMGAANNQLKAASPEEEIRLARLLDERGILFQVDWVHNAGGVIAGMEEYLRGEDASLENVLAQTEKACRDGTRENLRAARAAGVTPTEMAYRTHGERIFG